METNHSGSCHCGAVHYEVELDLADGTSRCNCSICRKSRFWKAIAPAAAFRLTRGADELTEYRFGDGRIGHHFCSRCGVKVFGETHIPDLGGDIVAISVATLDDVDPAELAPAPVSYQDGAGNAWDNAPAVTEYL